MELHVQKLDGKYVGGAPQFVNRENKRSRIALAHPPLRHAVRVLEKRGIGPIYHAHDIQVRMPGAEFAGDRGAVKHDSLKVVVNCGFQPIHQFCQFSFHSQCPQLTTRATTKNYQLPLAPPPPKEPPPNPPKPPPPPPPPHPPPPNPPPPIIIPPIIGPIHPPPRPPLPPPRLIRFAISEKRKIKNIIIKIGLGPFLCW